MKVVYVSKKKESIQILNDILLKVTEEPSFISFQDSKLAHDFCVKESPDIIFIDMNLKTSNGVSLTKKILSENPNLHVIIISNNEKNAYDAFGARAKGYLIEPINMEMILDELNKIA